MEYLRIIWNIMDYLQNVIEYPGHIVEYLWNILDYLRNLVEYHGTPKEYNGFIYGMSYNVMEYLRNIMEYLSMGYNGIFCTLCAFGAGPKMGRRKELRPTRPGSTRRLRGEYAETPPVFFGMRGL